MFGPSLLVPVPVPAETVGTGTGTGIVPFRFADLVFCRSMISIVISLA